MVMYEQRQKMKDSIWFWHFCNAYAKTSSEQWWIVAAGEAISDELIAASMDISVATVRRWRVQLEKLGFIRSMPGGPRKRTFEVKNLSFVETVSASAPKSTVQRVN